MEPPIGPDSIGESAPLLRTPFQRWFHPTSYPPGILGPLAPVLLLALIVGVNSRPEDEDVSAAEQAAIIAGVTAMIALGVVVLIRNLRTDVWITEEGVQFRTLAVRTFAWSEIRSLEAWTIPPHLGNTLVLRPRSGRPRVLPLGQILVWDAVNEATKAAQRHAPEDVSICVYGAFVRRGKPHPTGLPVCEPTNRHWIADLLSSK